ncbi:MAG TPA: 1-(5-phosphoribosyl)-5-[(5-phosphoribosylamino)methylideneamino]imidazole-4-carboxamide isomerase [Rhodospirillales bacterium]|jgi:phosphoribosylformimino-5-aminoimidazole carboxamide ribotide isomerase|nr:1-(5-phosphoribosyl)-5-[(5-phosphoribosylamino)methylideneamino]imidazole-4-carboxamide isomerase [Rhodospirillales bacterium]
MIFFPAIDLKDGRCVRLLKGDMSKVTVFNDDPGGQAKSFENLGCQWLHLVDLNGAFAGHPVNTSAVISILDAIAIPVQLGGGIRDLETISFWLDKGVRRVILGTVALHNRPLLKAACRRFPGRVAVAIDARDGFVAVEGWAEISALKAVDLADGLEDAGAAAIIYTDIGRDGVMQGPNIEATVALAARLSTPVIASGGVSSMDDLRVLKKAAADLLEGVISGRAVYDGRIDPAAAVALFKEAAG